MKTQTKRGGKRKGAGRPPGSTHVDPENLRIRISIRLPQHVIDSLRAKAIPMGTTIETALKHWKDKERFLGKDYAMKTLSDMIEEHLERIQKLKDATEHQADYIKMIEQSNAKLNHQLNELHGHVSKLIKAIPRIAD